MEKVYSVYTSELYTKLMDISKIHSKQYEMSEKLRPYVENKKDKLKKYYDCLRSGENSHYLLSGCIYELCKEKENYDWLIKLLSE